MRRFLSRLLIAAGVMLLPAGLFAMSHGHGEHDASAHHDTMHKSEHAEHGGMAAEGGMFIIGDMTSKGVKGMAHLKDVSEAMAKMNMPTTHHFMIAFVDEATGEQIETGTVALKVQDPDAKVTGPIKLEGMQGHFGADIVLDKPGEYHFKLGTKLADGVTRKFHFHHTITED